LGWGGKRDQALLNEKNQKPRDTDSTIGGRKGIWEGKKKKKRNILQIIGTELWGNRKTHGGKPRDDTRISKREWEIKLAYWCRISEKLTKGREAKGKGPKTTNRRKLHGEKK